MASWRTANINGDTDEWQVTTIGAKLNIDKDPPNRKTS